MLFSGGNAADWRSLTAVTIQNEVQVETTKDICCFLSSAGILPPESNHSCPERTEIILLLSSSIGDKLGIRYIWISGGAKLVNSMASGCRVAYRIVGTSALLVPSEVFSLLFIGLRRSWTPGITKQAKILFSERDCHHERLAILLSVFKKFALLRLHGYHIERQCVWHPLL